MKKLYLLLLLFVLTSLSGNTLLIEKMDGSLIEIPVENVVNMLFEDAEDWAININKIDNETDTINLEFVENIDFISTPFEALLIHKTDDTTYTVGIDQIATISFGDAVSNSNNLDASIPNISAINNYPNPFNPETIISFNLKNPGFTTIEIYNIKGEKVTTLLNRNLSSGVHTSLWNGQDEASNPVASGVYFYKIVNNNNQELSKMLLLK